MDAGYYKAMSDTATSILITQYQFN